MPPRPIRPKDEVSSAESGEAASDIKPGKRRAVSSACIPCRKRKSKCDGNLPSCSTCVAVYRTECSYDHVDSDHRRKGALKRDIQSLQQRNDALHVIVASLRALPEQEAITLLQSLRSDTSPDVIAATLRSSANFPNNVAAHSLETDLTQPGPSRSGASSAASAATSEPQLDSAIRSPVPPESATSDPKLETPYASWFTTPVDQDYVEHLLQLYFCWIHPFYHFFVKEHFLFDFRNGHGEHCSPALVYAILAMASTYSDEPLAQTQSLVSQQSEAFFHQAKIMLERQDRPCLTTVQACAIMSIRETSCGRDSSGYQYSGKCVRLASEMNLNLPINNRMPMLVDAEAAKTTFWSVFTLETLSSVSLGRLSQLPRSAIGIEKPETDEHGNVQTWSPYHDPSINEPHLEQRTDDVLFSNSLSQLCELASEMANTFYAPRESFTSRKLALAYANYRDWYNQLPEALWLKNTSLPHVVVLHMCYQAFVLHLFRPYIKLDLHGAKLYPRETCISCANEISNLMSPLRSLYGLRRVCPAIVGILYSASTIHLLNLTVESSDYLEQAILDLNAMSLVLPHAQRCVDNIRSLAAKWSIPLPEGASLAASLRTTTHSAMSPPGSILPSASYTSSLGAESFLPDSSSSKPGQTYYSFNPAQIQTQNLPDGSEDPVATVDILSSQLPVWTPITTSAMPFPPTDTGQPLGGQQSGITNWAVYDTSTINPHFQEQAGTTIQPDPGSGEHVESATASWPWVR